MRNRIALVMFSVARSGGQTLLHSVTNGRIPKGQLQRADILRRPNLCNTLFAKDHADSSPACGYLRIHLEKHAPIFRKLLVGIGGVEPQTSGDSE